MTLTNLYQARLKGLRPDGLVILTFVPELSRFVECIDVAIDQEVRGLTDLDVLLAFHSMQASSAIALTTKIVPATPWQLELWEIDTGNWQVVMTGNEEWCRPCPPKGGLLDLTMRLQQCT